MASLTRIIANPTPKIFNALPMAALAADTDVTIDIQDVDYLSVQVTATAASGSNIVACYASNDGTNWVALTSMTVTITGATSVLFRLGAPDYRYLQVRFTAGSGSTTGSVNVWVRKQVEHN